MLRYQLGNILRGTVEGEFKSLEEAWDILSYRFMLSYPTESGGGRSVHMSVQEKNKFGYDQFIQCRVDECSTNKIDDIFMVSYFPALIRYFCQEQVEEC